MDDRPFDQPVSILLVERGGRIRTVKSTREAVEILMYRWPAPTGRAHIAARKACLAVLGGLKEAPLARRAFEEAADEAAILIQSREMGRP